MYGQSGYQENVRYPVALGLLRIPGRKQLKKRAVVSVQELPLLPINVTPSNAPVALKYLVFENLVFQNRRKFNYILI